METKETEDIDEIGVDKEITKVMGTSLVRMQYKPKNMILKKYSVDSEQRRATLLFQYGDQSDTLYDVYKFQRLFPGTKNS